MVKKQKGDERTEQYHGFLHRFQCPPGDLQLSDLTKHMTESVCACTCTYTCAFKWALLCVFVLCVDCIKSTSSVCIVQEDKINCL